MRSNNEEIGGKDNSLTAKKATGLTCLSAASMLCLSTMPVSSAVLEEVVITAQKREQNLQDVSVSVQAFSGDQLDALGIDKATDLIAQVPNVDTYFIFGEAQQPSITVRGIGLINFNDSFEPPVAMYIDEVYQGAGVGQSIQMFDTERMEVLKGPQGTLYGRNATGGLINVITRKPTEELDLRVSAQIGDYGQTILEGAVGGPLTDGIRARISAKYNKDDGYTEGIDGSDYNQSDVFGIRSQIDFDLADDAMFRLSLAHSKADQNSTGYGLTGLLDPSTGSLCSVSQAHAGNCISNSFLSGLTPKQWGGYGPEDYLGSNLPTPPKLRVETNQISGRYEATFGEVDFVSITAFNKVKKYFEEDLDPIPLGIEETLTLDQKTFTQEVRVAGEYNEANWVLGAFYYKDTNKPGYSFFPRTKEEIDQEGTQDTQSFAVFGQIDLPISDTVNLVLGGRHTTEKRDLDWSSTGNFLEVSGLKLNVDSDVSTGRFGVDWRPAESTLVYASIATGFKSGGFNSQIIFDAGDIQPVENESVTAYEVGIKTSLWDGKARINAALFYTDYTDVQINTDTPQENTNIITSSLANGGDAVIRGFEADLTLIPSENLEILLGLGLLDTEIKSDESLTSTIDGLVSLDGNELPSSPEWTVNGVFRYSFPLESRGNLVLQADFNYRADVFYTINNSKYETQDSYGIWNLRAIWTSPNDHWNVEAYVENVGDEEYFTYALGLDDQTLDILWGKPRWAGFKVAYKY